MSETAAVTLTNSWLYQLSLIFLHIFRSSFKAPISWGQENTHLPLRTCFPTRKWPTRKWSTVQTQLELQECMCPRPRRSASIPLNPVLGPPIPANLGIFLGQDALHMLSCLPFAAKFQPERYWGCFSPPKPVLLVGNLRDMDQRALQPFPPDSFWQPHPPDMELRTLSPQVEDSLYPSLPLLKVDISCSLCSDMYFTA